MPRYRVTWSSMDVYYHFIDIPQAVVDQGEDAIYVYAAAEGFDSSVDDDDVIEQSIAEITLWDD